MDGKGGEGRLVLGSFIWDGMRLEVVGDKLDTDINTWCLKSKCGLRRGYLDHLPKPSRNEIHRCPSDGQPLHQLFYAGTEPISKEENAYDSDFPSHL